MEQEQGDQSKQSALSPSAGVAGSAFREITPEDITTESNKAYDLGRKHGKAELMDDIERARTIALRLVSDEGKSEIEEAFQRLLGISAPNDGDQP